MKQDFEGFLNCSHGIHYWDVAGKTACMVKNGYDPAVYTVQQATDLAQAQMQKELDQPTFGFSSVIFIILALLVVRWVAGGVVTAFQTKGRSMAGLFGADDSDATGSTWNGDLHWTIRQNIDGGFCRY
ncbi:MAG: hypothetical protein F8N36_13795 [Desulfovibrio sp.]|uniref:hypothetical protein n=1 Tax=Desulfovibrio sp. TaxID=885 RepID=UPI00135D7A2B|nr:hypothetical protein [Desulfovibrio sp.]MTJ93911.1 hypothetical protein [Desulfovibrio sp.]